MKTFTLSTDVAKGNALAHIATLKADGTMEVVIRKAQEGKTRQQLGAIFGCWEKYLSETWGHSIDEVHSWLKARFLARIYITEPMNEAQEQWVELVAIYQESGDKEKLERHSKRISLGWATLKQTKNFMDDISAHFQSIGQPLPVPDPLWREHEN